MPSTFTSNTGIEKIADGEQAGLWGQTTNLNFDIVDRALNGSSPITLSGTTHTLTTSDGVLSDGQYAVVVFTGSLSAPNTVTIAPNSAQKTYWVRNTTSQDVILSQGSGANVTVPPGATKAVYADGAGAGASVVDLTAGLIPVLANAGVTATTAELNILDGVTATTAELNILDGVSGIASQAEAEAGTNNTTLMTPLRSQEQRFANGPLAGFRNAIINGNFDHWQRGTSFSGAGYSADRWVHNVAGASGTVTQSRQAFTVGQTDVPNEPTYFYRIQGSSYTFDAANVTQRIEDVRTFAGQTVTVSFYARASASRELGVRFLQVFDGSAFVGTVASPVSLTTSFQKFTATVSVPSIAGKTVGANSRLELAFDIKQGAFGSNLNNDSIDIAQVQLEAGPVATPFERRPVGTELALCQRYFQKTDPTSSAGKRMLNSSGGTFPMNVSYDFPVTMRATPSLTVYGDINDGAQIVVGGAGGVITKDGFTQFTNVNNGQYLDYHYHIADSEL